jgi:hypothetical protein
MQSTAYERALFGNFAVANDDERPPAPNVIELAKKAIGRENIRSEPKGVYFVWSMGRWNGPLDMHGLIREANVRLKARGQAQIDANPTWVIHDSEVSA